MPEPTSARDVVRRIYSEVHDRPVDPWAAPQGPGRWAEVAERIIGELCANLKQLRIDYVELEGQHCDQDTHDCCGACHHDLRAQLATATARITELEATCDSDVAEAGRWKQRAEQAEVRRAALERFLTDFAATTGDSDKAYWAAGARALLAPAAPREAGCTCPVPTFTDQAPSPAHPFGSVVAKNLPTLRDAEQCPVHRRAAGGA